MKLLNKIENCEHEFIKCFTSYKEDENIIRYHDDLLKDMYYHNYTFIKKPHSNIKLKDIIDNEINLRKNKEYDFCNIVLNFKVNNDLLELYKGQVDIKQNGVYVLDINKLSNFKSVKDYEVRKINDDQMVADFLHCDLLLDEEVLGKDFCTRRCLRKAQVYLSNSPVDCYILYVNNQPVGSCELFIHDKTAKIESFSIIPQSQRKGYGTTLLKELIMIALNNGCDIIYLVADEEDTPKEMYLKLGFFKVLERTDLFFKFDK